MLPAVNEPRIPWNPPHALVRRTGIPLPSLDGRLDKPFWDQAAWIDDFHDIEGDALPRPGKRTAVKLLWDDDFLYAGFYLEEDQIWANVTDRNAVLFVDNDIEMFLAPVHGTYRYYELEMNARNVVWDLFLDKPNRDGAHRLISWDVFGLQSAVHVQGELNNPAAQNRYWSAELKIPWFSLRECGEGECYPARLAPAPGEIWRANFSRVKYPLDVKDGGYVRRADPATGRPLPENNWVWAPTGVIDIHMPEMWGYLLFSTGIETFTLPEDEDLQWRLRRLYYRQRNFGAARGCYTSRLEDLDDPAAWPDPPALYVTPSLFEITARGKAGLWHIREDGYIWRTED